MNQHLLGAAQAHRDMDVILARWNKNRWPFSFRAAGESDFGRGATYALFGAGGPRYSRAMLTDRKSVV